MGVEGREDFVPPVCCPVPLSGTQTAGWKGRGWLLVGAGLVVGNGGVGCWLGGRGGVGCWLGGRGGIGWEGDGRGGVGWVVGVELGGRW